MTSGQNRRFSRACIGSIVGGIALAGLTAPLASVAYTRTVPFPVAVKTGLTDPVAVVTRLPMRTPPASRNSQV